MRDGEGVPLCRAAPGMGGASASPFVSQAGAVLRGVDGCRERAGEDNGPSTDGEGGGEMGEGRGWIACNDDAEILRSDFLADKEWGITGGGGRCGAEFFRIGLKVSSLKP